MTDTLDAKQIGELFGGKSYGYVNWLMGQYPHFPRSSSTRAPAKGGAPARLWDKKAVIDFKAWLDEQSQAQKPALDNALALQFIAGGTRICSQYPSLREAF